MARRFEFRRRPFLRLKFAAKVVLRFLLFWREPSGLDRFRSLYAPPAAGTPGRAYDRCVGCSLCALTCTAIREGAAPPPFEPKYLLFAAADSPGAKAGFPEDWFPCAACARCTAECPTGVPIHSLAQWVREKSRITEAAAPPSGA